MPHSICGLDLLANDLIEVRMVPRLGFEVAEVEHQGGRNDRWDGAGAAPEAGGEPGHGGGREEGEWTEARKIER